MVRNLNPGRMSPMGGGKMYWWKILGDLALCELIVSQERYREITEKLYPEKEMSGRPGIICAYQPRKDAQGKRRISPEADEQEQAVAEVEVSDAWRVTPPEFEGSEEELVEEESVAA